MLAFVFPGQGAQRVGMGKELAAQYPAARRVFDEADAALGKAISRLCFEGPEDELLLTENSQPAILTTSIAVLRVLQERTHLKPAFVAGHSLGEYSALVCAGALELADAVRVVQQRGQLMQAAVPFGQGAMAAIVGLSLDDVVTLYRDAAQGEVLTPANFNSPRQIVISGHTAAVDRAIALAGERKGTAKKLRVSAPFHCPLMAPAATQLATVLAATRFRDARLPVVANVDAAPHREGATFARLLVEQVTAAVRWTDTVVKLKALGVGHLVGLARGPGPGGPIGRFDRTLAVASVGTGPGLEALIARADQLQPRRPQDGVTLPDGRIVWNDGLEWHPSAPGAFGF